MKAEGTREEVLELAREISKTWNDKHTDLEDAVIDVFDRRGYITKPKWEQKANLYENQYQKWIGTNEDMSETLLLEQGIDAINSMRDRIVELEKIVREGK